jgi:hypothetical protein
MKRLVLAALALTAAPALAQDHSAHTAPATTAPAAAAKFSLDTPIETLVADAKAKTVLDASLPGLTTHESYDMFKSMSLTQLSGMAPDRLTPEKLAKVQAELATVK